MNEKIETIKKQNKLSKPSASLDLFVPLSIAAYEVFREVDGLIVAELPTIITDEVEDAEAVDEEIVEEEEEGKDEFCFESSMLSAALLLSVASPPAPSAANSSPSKVS